MDFTADFYFRQTWHDPRLAFTKINDIKTLYVGAEVSKKIWLPDTFFGNEKMVSKSDSSCSIANDIRVQYARCVCCFVGSFVRLFPRVWERAINKGNLLDGR